MPKDEWGVKRLCPHCASRFYDLCNDPMTCPECSQKFTAESLVAGRGRTVAPEKVAPRAREADTEVEANPLNAEDDLEDDSADSDLDDDLLEDDDGDEALDDIADVATNDEES